MVTGWFVTADYAARNQAALGKFARVMRDAEVYANAHQDEMAQLIAPFVGVYPIFISQALCFAT